MASDDSRIKISTIPYGLRQEETIVQIAAALDNVNSVVTDVFQQIEYNIQRHKQYLTSLQKRSAVIALKVDKLAGKNVTTTVYSHHKYPFEEHQVDTLFRMNLKPLEKKIDVPIESKFQPVKYNKIPNKLQFFHVNYTVNASNNFSTSLERGLGALPPEINHVDSLFLFNTAQNVYEKYVMIDPLSVTDSKPVTEEIEKTDIAAAPKSIVNSEMYRNENYFTGFYTPAFEKVPSIDVPLNLPDLPGIAGDLRFSAVAETSAASSKPQQDAGKSKSIDEITIADLPVISKATKQAVLSSQEISVPAIAKSDTNSELSPLSAPPPPPPPAPAPLLPTSVPPPPPPPMPVDNLGNDSISTVDTAQHGIASSNAVAPSENVHATLMEAIRKAGGREKARLRQVDQVEQQPSVAKSGDTNEDLFMNDLYAALARRRKGISGQIKDNKNVSIMDRVSAMIPQASDESDDNSVEEDGNEWED